MPGNTFRLATFNVENLFARYKFRSNASPTLSDGWTINETAFEVFDEPTKRITARAIAEVNADAICIQEVESLPLLDRFASRYLAKLGYKHRVLVDSHDPRGIDVAVLSRHPIVGVRSHRHETVPNSGVFLFSRDCLEVELAIGTTKPKSFVAFVNHFKSMMDGRDKTHARRKMQADRVVDIVMERLSSKNGTSNFAVLGDLNDYPDAKSALTDLVQHKTVTNVVTRLPEDDQWTHFYSDESEYRQLDYLLLGRDLDSRAGKPKPAVMRKGLCRNATKYDGDRFEEVGDESPAASDHCPVFVDIPITALT